MPKKEQESMERSIALLLPVSNQPRYLKRIHLLTKLGYRVTAYYFDRNDPVPQLTDKNVQFVRIAFLEHGNYLKRLLPLGKLVKTIRKDPSPATYVFSADLLLAAVLAGKNEIIFEIGDIREINSPLFRRLYAYLLSKCARIIVTSDRFATYLIETYGADPAKILFHPHLLEPHQFNPDSRVREKSLISPKELHIGFVGLLRYTSVGRLLDTCRDFPHFRVHIHGRGAYEEEVRCKVVSGKDKYAGAFLYPDDLKEIYASIDINYVMYDTSDTNVTMALPNKLYESIYFATPLIVSSGTYLADLVEGYGIGLVWDYNRIDTLCQYLDSDTFRHRHASMVKNILAIPNDDIMRTHDHLKELFNDLKKK